MNIDRYEALTLEYRANSTVLILHRHTRIGITIAESIGSRRSQICPFAGREQQAGDMQRVSAKRDRKREREREKGEDRASKQNGGWDGLHFPD